MTAPCPQCGKPVQPDFAPFCSRRCQQIDLGRWLKGDYAIPGSPIPPPGSAGNGEDEPE